MAGVKNTDSALLDLYFQDISDSSPLPADTETELAKRIRVGDGSARNTLVQANLRFVVRVASEFQGCGMDLEDLISAGNVGLIKAAERFDPDRGVKFITYALWWIRQAILNSLSQDSQTVRLPANRVKLLNSIVQLSRQLRQANGEEPGEETLADVLGVPVKRVREMMMWSRDIASLDQTNGTEEDYQPLQVIPDETLDAPDAVVSDASDQAQLQEALASLEERRRKFCGSTTG